MYYIKKTNMICFDSKELRDIFEFEQKRELYKLLATKGYTAEELVADNKQKMQEIAEELVAKGIKSKEDIEIFSALDFCFSYLKSDDSKICFVLKKGLQANKVIIKNIDDLKKSVEECTLTDFAIWYGGLRQFQLKQYKGNLNTEDFYNFIQKVLISYGNQLGEINLLIILQGHGAKNAVQISEIDFNKIHNKVKDLDLKFTGEILVKYNENNTHEVLCQIYPELKSMQKNLSISDSSWE